jgi:hypothetical protein
MQANDSRKHRPNRIPVDFRVTQEYPAGHNALARVTHTAIVIRQSPELSRPRLIPTSLLIHTTRISRTTSNYFVLEVLSLNSRHISFKQ